MRWFHISNHRGSSTTSASSFSSIATNAPDKDLSRSGGETSNRGCVSKGKLGNSSKSGITPPSERLNRKCTQDVNSCKSPQLTDTGGIACDDSKSKVSQTSTSNKVSNETTSSKEHPRKCTGLFYSFSSNLSKNGNNNAT